MVSPASCSSVAGGAGGEVREEVNRRRRLSARRVPLSLLLLLLLLLLLMLLLLSKSEKWFQSEDEPAQLFSTNRRSALKLLLRSSTVTWLELMTRKGEPQWRRPTQWGIKPKPDKLELELELELEVEPTNCWLLVCARACVSLNKSPPAPCPPGNKAGPNKTFVQPSDSCFTPWELGLLRNTINLGKDDAECLTRSPC